MNYLSEINIVSSVAHIKLLSLALKCNGYAPTNVVELGYHVTN